MPLILDAIGQYRQPVDFRRHRRCQRPHAHFARRRDIGGGTGAVRRGFRCNPVRIQKRTRLRDQNHMRAHMFDVVQRLAGVCHDGNPHTHERLADNTQAGLRQQAVNVGNAAIGRVLDRQHGQIGSTVVHGGNHIVKGGARHGNRSGPCFQAGFVTIGAQISLKGDTFRHDWSFVVGPGVIYRGQGDWSR